MQLKLQSKCPKCGNVDVINEDEALKDVHCQRCYHNYDFKVNDIKSRITKDSNGVSSYLGVYIDEMDWMVEQTEKVAPLISVALWSIRRLPNNISKASALVELKKVVGEEHKYSKFIDDCINELRAK